MEKKCWYLDFENSMIKTKLNGVEGTLKLMMI